MTASSFDPDEVVLVEGVETCVAALVQEDPDGALAFWGVGRVVLLCCRASECAVVAGAVPVGVRRLRTLRFAVDVVRGRVVAVHDAAGRALRLVRTAHVPWDRVVLVLDTAGADIGLPGAASSGPLGALRLGSAPLVPIDPQTVPPNDENCNDDDDDDDSNKDEDNNSPAIETLAQPAAAGVEEEGMRVVPARVLPRVHTLTNARDGAPRSLLHSQLLCLAACGTPVRTVARQCAVNIARRVATARFLAMLIPDSISNTTTQTSFVDRVVCASPLACALVLTMPAVARLADGKVLAGLRRGLQAALGLGTATPRIHPRAACIPAELCAAAAGPAALDAARDAALARSGHLADVGAALAARGSGTPGLRARVGATRGYAFYHYGQDGVRDEGWGCAYRSLQTLWSWLRRHGATGAPVPTHRGVQELLVALGDKPRSFAGARAWIGAVEVGLCLQAGAGVEYRMLHVRQDDTVAEHTSTFIAHFRTEGTPVMVGGGVRAYTVLAVEWPECWAAERDGCGSGSSGVRFLILDPHYTGPDTEREILRRGGCSWRKAEDVFPPDKFYNFCFPFLPKGF